MPLGLPKIKLYQATAVRMWSLLSSNKLAAKFSFSDAGGFWKWMTSWPVDSLYIPSSLADIAD